MQGSAPPTGGDQHEQVVSAALDLICSSSEQTYTQFLASFTQLNPETLRSEGPRHTLITVTPEDMRDNRGEDGVTHLRGPQDPPHLLELSNSLDKAALREEHVRDDLQVSGLLPGEVEEAGLPACTSSVSHSTQLEMSSAGNTTHSTNLPSGEHTTRSASNDTEMHTAHTVTSNQQVGWEEVQPFHLDEDFDYDHVVLTHKYPALRQNPTAN
ncbi:uncharacterized protein LOC116220037 [Clupea harengus]|uniref:Uncharacterized protein LOC116220037 n=1 Tax=Clupea harengus TaxID=7950 RepID=A0A6P8FAY2_CLUHA|nr:uncharacterized protein LOC116220037 [Clupea harengus]XP_031421017.1 uncharacterized protein LOC116220037 [Clupea harengus]XP_031421018.1 uncharacterized protein LOC116220037 [Clupea harengus]